jgi:hypothetical protein
MTFYSPQDLAFGADLIPVDAGYQLQADWNKVSPSIKTMQDAFPALGTIMAGLRQVLVNIKLDATLSDRGQMDKFNAAFDTALRSIDALQASFQAAGQAVEDQLNVMEASATAPAPTDPTLQLLAEQQLQRAWNRLVRQLDAILDTSDLEPAILTAANVAAQVKDAAMLAAIKAEIPGYLAARNARSGDVHLDVDRAMQRVAAAEAPFLGERARAAKVIEEQCAGGYARFMAACDICRRELNGGTSVYGLPGWHRNTQLDIGVPIQSQLKYRIAPSRCSLAPRYVERSHRSWAAASSEKGWVSDGRAAAGAQPKARHARGALSREPTHPVRPARLQQLLRRNVWTRSAWTCPCPRRHWRPPRHRGLARGDGQGRASA